MYGGGAVSDVGRRTLLMYSSYDGGGFRHFGCCVLWGLWIAVGVRCDNIYSFPIEFVRCLLVNVEWHSLRF